MTSKKVFKIADATVGDMMTRHVVTVDMTTNVHALMELMNENHLSAVPVADGHGRCVGIASHSDLADLLVDLDSQHEQLIGDVINRLTGGESGSNVLVKEIMTHDVVTVHPETPLAAASELMTRRTIHHLPVVDNKGVLCGFLSSLDIVKFLASHL